MQVGYDLYKKLRRNGVPALYAPFEVMSFAENRFKELFHLAQLDYLDGYRLPKEFTAGMWAAIPSFFPERWFEVPGPDGVTPLTPGFH
jgi:hypothetical protein